MVALGDEQVFRSTVAYLQDFFHRVGCHSAIAGGDIELGQGFFVFRGWEEVFELPLNVAQTPRKLVFYFEAAAEGRSLRRLRHEEVVVGRGGKEIQALGDLGVEVGRKQRRRRFKNVQSLLLYLRFS